MHSLFFFFFSKVVSTSSLVYGQNLLYDTAVMPVAEMLLLVSFDIIKMC